MRTNVPLELSNDWTESVMDDERLLRERLFRQFQIEKYRRNRLVPGVSMTIDIDVTGIQQRRRSYNSGVAERDRITLTHVLIRAASLALAEFPVLYALFDGNRVVASKELRINLPIAEGNHVEYLIIRSPETKTLPEISTEIREGTELIRQGEGEFYLRLKTLFWLPRFLRRFVTSFMPIAVRLAYKRYGNFPITNFGSFGVKNGMPVLSSPVISVLCFGMIQMNSCCSEERGQHSTEILPVTLVFDHRPIDGAYAGNFLNKFKTVIETAGDSIFH